ncbi:hypothetical protein [Herbaspirillum chlorophenolicum]|uniref:hypothetical protein n=1 Tax=Herbaspirillum chlorophenolicum TaxID=211589 RepID=UPI00067CE0EF|nr:hypothetical protein [Herbaspirillum chlorophenolicum]
MKTKIALVGPNFFSYIQAIRQSLMKKGYESQFFDERHKNTIIVKILYRLGFYEWFPAVKRRYLDGVAQAILAQKCTDALLIGVEVCDEDFVQKLKKAGVRVHLYMWDSARNKPRYLKYLPWLDGKSSFDPIDCAEHGLTYIPLFSESVFSQAIQVEKADKDVDISFCGTLHSNRADWLNAIRRFGNKYKLKVVFYIFFHSRPLLFIKSIARPSNANFLRSMSTAGFSKQEIAALFRRSKFVFDIQHPGQIGLTARTFEVLRSGTKLITSNRFSSELPLDLAERVIVIDNVQQLESVDFSCGFSVPPLTEEQDYFLSIERFTDQLIDIMGVDREHHATSTQEVA